MKRATTAGPQRYNDCSLGSKACNSSPVAASPLEKSYMIAFDTNVLIYACDRVDPKRQCQAIELISTAADVVLLWQVACEFVAASRKLSTQGFTSDHAWARLSEYSALFPLILPVRYWNAQSRFT